MESRESGAARKISGKQQDTAVTQAPKISAVSIASVLASIVLVAGVCIIVFSLINETARSDKAHEIYENCSNAATELMITSDYLTSQSRMFVITGNRQYLDAYLEELFVTKTRDEAVALLASESENDQATSDLAKALSNSNTLATTELYAMKLAAEAIDLAPLPEELATIEIKPGDEAISPSEKRKLSESLVLSNDYEQAKVQITRDVDRCVNDLVKHLEQNVVSIETHIHELLMMLAVAAALLMLLVFAIAMMNFTLVIHPLRRHSHNLMENKPLDHLGCHEIQSLVASYNRLYEETRLKTADLKQKAETDPLTGAFNRSSFDTLIENADEDTALVLADVDLFKDINDTYGHVTGDGILKRVTTSITSHFRTVDHVCRIGGDEFAVILMRATPQSKDAIAGKLESIAEELSKPADGLPGVTLSIGVAFNNDNKDGANLYSDADKALYESKRRGRNAITFHDE